MIVAVSYQKSCCEGFSFKSKLGRVAEKIRIFIERFWKDIVVYGVTLVVTFVASLISPLLGRAVASAAGFFWVVGNTPGKPRAEDFLEEVALQNLGSYPSEGREDLVQRYEILNQIYKNLQLEPGPDTPTLGWSLIYGDVGTGKSEAARYLAHHLKQQGVRIYLLKNSPSLSNTDAYTLINAKLKGIFPTPVLIIDEAWNLIQTGDRGWGALKKTLGNTPNFNVLAISDRIEGIDPGILSRFGSDKFLWPPLSVESVIELVKAKKGDDCDVEAIVHKLIARDEGKVVPDLLRLAISEVDREKFLKNRGPHSNLPAQGNLSVRNSLSH